MNHESKERKSDTGRQYEIHSALAREGQRTRRAPRFVLSNGKIRAYRAKIKVSFKYEGND